MKHLRKICKNGPARPGPAQLDPTRPGPARPSPDLSGSARSASYGPARPGMRPGPDRPSPAIPDKISQNLTIFNNIIKMQIWELVKTPQIQLGLSTKFAIFHLRAHHGSSARFQNYIKSHNFTKPKSHKIPRFQACALPATTPP